MPGAMEAADAEAESAESASLASFASRAPKMQNPPSLDSGPTGKVRNDETPEAKLLGAALGATTGGAEDAGGSQPAVPERVLRSEQPSPADSQHDASSRASDSPAVSPVPSLPSHDADSEEGGNFQGGRFQGGAEAGREAANGAIAGPFVVCNFAVLPERYRHRLEAPIDLSVGEVVQKVAEELNVPAFMIRVQQAGNDVEQDQRLENLLKASQAELESDHRSLDFELLLDFERSASKTEGVEAPETQEEPGQVQAKRPTVEIERCATKQPFLGGYRNKQTGRYNGCVLS